MNKYLLALFGALMIIISFSSCTDQKEIGITYSHEIMVEVNPLALYENSGIELSKFQSIMGEGLKSNVIILVYNNKGLLDQMVNKTVDTLQPFTMELSDLDEADYTIVAIQQLAILEGNNTFRAWKLEDISDIKKVRIVSANEVNPWYMCLGIDIQNINIKKDSSLRIATKLAGSFVEFKYENVNYSSYDWLALCFKHKADGLYLNPELQGQAKYYYKDSFNSGRNWSVVSYFSSDRMQNSSNEQIGFFLDTGRINYCFGLANEEDANSDGSIDFAVYPSNDSYFEAEIGKIYSAFCYYNGETREISTYMGLKSDFEKWYNTLEKWTKPPFDIPFTKWGASVLEVKNYMKDKGYSIWFDVQRLESVSGDYYYYLGYESMYLEDNTQYVFATETINLLCAFVYVYEYYYGLKDIIKFFESNSEYKKFEPFEDTFLEYGDYVFYNKETVIYITPNYVDENGDIYTLIGYYPNQWDDDLYMVGNMNGWSFSSDWKFIPYNDQATIYYLNVPSNYNSQILPTDEFIIASQDWETMFKKKGDTPSIDIETPTYLERQNGDNITLKYGWTGICWLDTQNNMFAYSNFNNYRPPFITTSFNSPQKRSNKLQNLRLDSNKKTTKKSLLHRNRSINALR